MNNSDLLIGIKESLNLEESVIVEIFNLGDIELDKEIVLELLEEYEGEEKNKKCTDEYLESFLNGFIVYKRGKKETKPGEVEPPRLPIKPGRSANNVVLKKLKIALSLSNDDLIDIFEEAEVEISKNELTTLFRKEGHKHYKRCNDKLMTSFLIGLAAVDV